MCKGFHRLFLIAILFISSFLTSCNTLDRLNNEKQEQRCFPGTQCWERLSTKSQRSKRQQMLRTTQEQQQWQQSSHSSGLWAIQPKFRN